MNRIQNHYQVVNQPSNNQHSKSSKKDASAVAQQMIKEIKASPYRQG